MRRRVPGSERVLDRRRLLLEAGAATAVLAAGPLARAARADRSGPRVAIVGAGLAGLRCAHRLWTRHGVASTVYEADTTHVGGRCWSLRGFFDGGLVGEHGGAFINSDQVAIRRLVRELGLHTEFVGGGDRHRGSEAYWFDGLYTQAQADADWAARGHPAVQAALAAAPWPQL